MKIIVSHDVDHVSVTEHWNDLILPKFAVRTLIEFSKGYVTAKEVVERIGLVFSNKFNNVKELMEFDRSCRVPSTFFVGVARGRGMKYSYAMSRLYVEMVLSQGFEVGIHGVEYVNRVRMKKERDKFREVVGDRSFGIRIHYLKVSDETLLHMSRLGYLYDTSVMGFKNPYKIGAMWEFPLQVMDGYVINGEKRWQSRTLDEALDEFHRLLDRAFSMGLDYFSILFHDRYFSDAFITWRKWYEKVIEYLKDNGFVFMSYDNCIKELEKELDEQKN